MGDVLKSQVCVQLNESRQNRRVAQIDPVRAPFIELVSRTHRFDLAPRDLARLHQCGDPPCRQATETVRGLAARNSF